MRKFWISLVIWVCFPFAVVAQNNGGGSQHILPVDQAFVLSAKTLPDTGDRVLVQLDWKITSGFYLYQNSLAFRQGKQRLKPVLPTPRPHHDPVFGQVEIYSDSFSVTLPLVKRPNLPIIVEYRGCASSGFCYPPQARALIYNSDQSLSVKAVEATNDVHMAPTSPQQQVAQQLSAHLWAFGLIFLFGIALAFTPCVLPLYPLLLASLFGGKPTSRRQALGFSLVYVHGMAMTYIGLALLASFVGITFQSVLQGPIAIGVICVLIVFAALSMLGVFHIQLPASLQTWFAKRGQGNYRFRWLNLLVLGMFSGVLSSPCTSVPLSGILLYLTQSEAWSSAALALYLLTLGMGVPLIILALGGHFLLPRSAPWMEKVRQAVGLVLLALPILLLARIWPDWVIRVLWMLFVLAMMIGLMGQLLAKSRHRLLLRRWFVLIGMVGIAIVGTLNYQHRVQQSLTPMISVTDLSSLQQQLLQAKRARRAVLLDFSARWCVACKQLEQQTLLPSTQALKGVTLIKVDLTENNEASRQLQRQFTIIGLPTLDLIDGKGNWLKDERRMGYIDSEALRQMLTVVKN